MMAFVAELPFGYAHPQQENDIAAVRNMACCAGYLFPSFVAEWIIRLDVEFIGRESSHRMREIIMLARMAEETDIVTFHLEICFSFPGMWQVARGAVPLLVWVMNIAGYFL